MPVLNKIMENAQVISIPGDSNPLTSTVSFATVLYDRL